MFSFILDASIIISSVKSILGGVESTSDICCCMKDMFCITSVTYQVTIVSPNENTSGASFSIEITPTSSDTDGYSSFTRFSASDLASSLISGNCSISGNVVS